MCANMRPPRGVGYTWNSTAILFHYIYLAPSLENHWEMLRGTGEQADLATAKGKRQYAGLIKTTPQM